MMPNSERGTPLSQLNSRSQIPIDLVRTISSTSTRDAVNKADIDKQLDLEKADNSHDISEESSSRTSRDDTQITASDLNAGKTVVSFTRNDPLNPYCWPLSKKIYVTVTGIVLVLNSTIGSSIATGASSQTAEQFGITNQAQLVLPTSIYLIGYVVAPLVFSPLSEQYGRKIVMISTFVLYTAFTLGCALAPSWSGLIIMRLLAGVGASTPISVIGGIYADIYATPKARGRAMALFMGATTWGPLLGPVASGYIAVVSWRWVYWLQLIIAGVTWPFVLMMPETYGPVVLKGKAKKMRKEGKDNAFAPIELEEKDIRELLVVVLTRPIRMFLFEMIVLCSCLYTALVYAIFYMFLQAYPIIFTGVYGFNAGERGLAFLPIGVGSIISCCVFLLWDVYLDRTRNKVPQPAWYGKEEYRRVPLACLGAPLLSISMFWLGWTARPSIHWIVPVLAAIPFGIAYLLIFMALLNYLVDAYEIFSASATAAASCSRSLFAVVLPFAARPMYERLGIAWACSLLGFISLVLGVIPFFFLKYGDQIRARSKFCKELARKKIETDQATEKRFAEEDAQKLEAAKRA